MWLTAVILDWVDYATFPSSQKVLLVTRLVTRLQGRKNRIRKASPKQRAKREWRRSNVLRDIVQEYSKTELRHRSTKCINENFLKKKKVYIYDIIMKCRNTKTKTR